MLNYIALLHVGIGASVDIVIRNDVVTGRHNPQPAKVFMNHFYNVCFELGFFFKLIDSQTPMFSSH